MSGAVRTTWPRGQAPTRARFWLRKLHSLSGVVPVGGFFVVHLVTESSDLRSGISEELAKPTPVILGVKGAVVLAPLAFHAAYGVVLALQSRPTVGSYPTSRNWMHLAQRVTGILAMFFIAWHVWEVWIPQITGALDARDVGAVLTARLSSTNAGIPLVALGYLAGLGACSVHFANGLWGFFASWGLAVTRRSQRALALGFGVLGLVLFVIAADATVHYATGAGFLERGDRRPGEPVE